MPFAAASSCSSDPESWSVTGQWCSCDPGVKCQDFRPLALSMPCGKWVICCAFSWRWSWWNQNISTESSTHRLPCDEPRELLTNTRTLRASLLLSSSNCTSVGLGRVSLHSLRHSSSFGNLFVPWTVSDYSAHNISRSANANAWVELSSNLEINSLCAKRVLSSSESSDSILSSSDSVQYAVSPRRSWSRRWLPLSGHSWDPGGRSRIPKVCLGSDWSRSQTFHSSERRHRGFVYCHQRMLRSWSRWRQDRNETEKRNVQQSHDKRDRNECSEMRDTHSNLEPMRCSHTGKVQCCMNCAQWGAHEKNVSARVQVGVVSTPPVALTAVGWYWLSAKLRFSNFCKDIWLEQNEARFQTFWLLVTTLNLSFWVG